MMVDTRFLDTDVLVYAHDDGEPEKQRVSSRLLRELGTAGVISTQVLQEFYVAATRKLGITPLVAKRALSLYERMDVVVIESPLIQRAIDSSIIDQIHFWDALIVVAAATAGCSTLITEDLNDGQVIQGVRVENPFASSGPVKT